MLRCLVILAASSVLCSDLNPVQELTLIAATSSQIHVRWTVPPTEELALVRGYSVCAGLQDGTPKCINIYNAHVGEYLIADTTPCEEYKISVVVLGNGNSESNAVNLLVSTAPGPAADLTLEREGSTGILARWSYSAVYPGNECSTQFKLTWCAGGARPSSSSGCVTARIPVAVGVPAYSLPLHDLDYCGRYTASLGIIGGKQRQSSDLLEAVLHEHPIGAPENLRTTNYTSSSVEVQWDIPEKLINCDYIVFVELEFTESLKRKSFTMDFAAGRTSYSRNDVAPCKAYTITVGFRKSTVQTNASIIAYTLPKGDEIFSNASIINVTPSSVTVAWTTLPENYECVTLYSICWGKDNATDHCYNTTNDNFVINQLESSSNYLISVEARLGNGSPLESQHLIAFTSSGAAGAFSNSVTKMLVIWSLWKCLIKNNHEIILKR